MTGSKSFVRSVRTSNKKPKCETKSETLCGISNQAPSGSALASGLRKIKKGSGSFSDSSSSPVDSKPLGRKRARRLPQQAHAEPVIPATLAELVMGIKTKDDEQSQYEIVRRPASGSLGHLVVEYLRHQNQTNQCQEVDGFNLRRLEPFIGSMNASVTDISRHCASLFVELSNHLINLDAVRCEQHVSLFKSCVEQKLCASKTWTALQEFAKFALFKECDSITDDISSHLPIKLSAASPLEILQRTSTSTSNEEAQVRHTARKLHEYREAVAARNRHLTQKSHDEEKLFPCIMQKNTITALIKASNDLQNHNVPFDINNIIEVATKYNALCTKVQVGDENHGNNHKQTKKTRHRKNAAREPARALKAKNQSSGHNSNQFRAF